MSQLQLLTAMRSAELSTIAICDIDCFEYQPAEQKNSWRGHKRVIALGPLAHKSGVA